MKLPRSAAKYKTADYAPLLVNVFALHNLIFEKRALCGVLLSLNGPSIHTDAYFP
jgi:hypothetical protein